VIVLFRQHQPNAETRPQYIHRMARRAVPRVCLAPRPADPQFMQLHLIAAEFGPIRQLAMDQQIGDFLELAAVGDVENVVAAVVQIVAVRPTCTGGIAATTRKGLRIFSA